MKAFWSIFILMGTLSSAAMATDDGPTIEIAVCVTAEQAKAALESHIKYNAGDLLNTEKYFDDEVANTNAGQQGYESWLTQFTAKATGQLVWSAEYTNYTTGDVMIYECAPSSQCWGGYQVSCSGHVTDYLNGED